MVVVYEGEVTQDITKAVLAMTERNMDAFGEAGNVKRKVFNVMVECLQNVSKHAENFDAESNAKNNALISIGKDKDEYVIISGNAVLNENVEMIKGKIDQINVMDDAELKALYKDIIKNGSLSAKGGAGLGLVDMRRKSGNKLGYDFEPINEKLAFFSLKLVISRTTTNE